MAKMFYTMDETKSALAKNEEEIKQLAREGRLREFRDGTRLMFKADQVEQLKGELAGGGGADAISIAPESESGAPIGLVDSQSSGGSAFVLADSGLGGSPGKDDTHLADLGFSGALGAVGSKSDSRAGSSAGSKTGITLDVDESRRAEAGDQTVVNAAMADQVNLEGAGSGSGLLDLTRESDDTSLGAVFDELTPSGGRRPTVTPSAAMETQAGEDLGVAVVDRAALATLMAPVTVSGPDAMSSALAFASVGALFAVCFGGFVVAAATMGYRPAILDSLRWEGSFPTYFGVTAGATVVLGLIGMFVGKAGSK
jgi:hypothetical protein